MAKTLSKEDRELSDLLKKLRETYLEDPAEKSNQQTKKQTEADRKFQEQLAKMMDAISDPMAETEIAENAEEPVTTEKQEDIIEKQEAIETSPIEKNEEKTAPIKKERKKTVSEKKSPKKAKKAAASEKEQPSVESLESQEMVAKPEVVAEAVTEVVEIAEPVVVTEVKKAIPPKKVFFPDEIQKTDSNKNKTPEKSETPIKNDAPTKSEAPKKRETTKKGETPKKSGKAVHYLPDDLPNDRSPIAVKTNPSVNVSDISKSNTRCSENEPIRIVPKQREPSAPSAEVTKSERIVIRPPVSKVTQTERFVIRPRNEKTQQTAKKANAEVPVSTDAPIMIGKEKVSDKNSEE